MLLGYLISYLEVKKNGKIRVCIAFINLNLASPKDEYPMLIADLMVV